MIEEETAQRLRRSAQRLAVAADDLRAGRSLARKGLLPIATEYVAARVEHNKLFEQAHREDQTLEEGT